MTQTIDQSTDIGAFVRRVLALLSEEIRNSVPDVKGAILKSGEKALRAAGKDINRWNQMLSSGLLTRQEYEWLIAARVALIQVDSLKASGLALVKIDEFRVALARSIVGAAFAGIGF